MYVQSCSSGLCLSNLLEAREIENEGTLLRQSDIVCKNEFATAFINSFLTSSNEEHVIIVPNQHFEISITSHVTMLMQFQIFPKEML